MFRVRSQKLCDHGQGTWESSLFCLLREENESTKAGKAVAVATIVLE